MFANRALAGPQFKRVIGLSCIVVTLSACSTMKMPNLDFVKFPEFLEEARNIKSYPNVADAPDLPTDFRTAEEWDALAREIMAARRGVSVLDLPQHAAFSDAEFEALKAQARAYKLDDPQ